MTNKTSADVISSFEGMFQDRVEIPETLERQWFDDALGDYEINIEETGYDKESDCFPEGFSQGQILTLALMMKRSYCERELSRVNKIQNIVGKDVSMTGSGDQKHYTYEELKHEQNRISDLLNKQTISWFS